MKRRNTNSNSADVKGIMGKLIFSISLLLVMAAPSASANMNTIRYVNFQQITKNALIIDTRNQAVCQNRSFAGAHCFPAADLMGKKDRLPSFADIFWALGTAGLEGSETVLVVGDRQTARDFIAGVLYLSGQAKIEVLDANVNDILSTGQFKAGHGISRQMLRSRIYRATMRDSVLILPDELRRLSNRRFQVHLIDASRFKNRGIVLEKIKQENRQKGNFLRVYILYAAKPSRAIALFARLHNEASNVTNKIKVMPVAIQHVHGGSGQGAENKRPYIFSAQSITRLPGVKQWI